MNYDQARQIEATGKWNWTTMNDRATRTAPPCFFPDVDWDSVQDAVELPPLTGRERCDHDTQDEAERHYHDDRVAHVRVLELDLDTIRERRRCDVPGCSEWEVVRANWPGGYEVDSLCAQHADKSSELHPFTPGLQVIHS